MRHFYKTTLEELNGAAVDVEVEVEVTPGDPGYRYNRNGDGCPPSPPEAELIGVRVTKVYGETEDLERSELSKSACSLWDAAALHRLATTWHDGESDRALEIASEAAEEYRY